MHNDSLKALHTALIDAQEGYDKAEKETDDAEIRAIFRDVHGLHGVAHGEIHRTLADLGEKPDDSGSFMGTVHKAVIATRAAVTGIDKSSLSSFASGEERIVEKYDDAIADQKGNQVASMLKRQKAALQEAIARMKQLSLAESAAG